MRDLKAHTAYQQTSVRGATPLGQVVALYDTVLRDCYRAQAAMELGDVEARIYELNHAITVLGELQNVLDFEKGGDVANRLKSFYEVSRAMILEICVSPSPEGLKRIIEIFTPVRQAWQQVSQELPVTATRESAPAMRISMTQPLVAPPPEEALEAERPAALWRG